MSKLLIYLVIAMGGVAHAMTPSQVAVYFPIAHSGRDEERYNVKYELEEPDGWKRFVAATVQPILDLGVTTIQLHNPGGHRLSDGHMRYLQFSRSKQSGYDFINDFTAAIKPVVDSGIRVIAYVGSPDDTDSQKPGAWPTRNRHTQAELTKTLLAELSHVTAAGCCIGLDNVTSKPVGSLSWWLANREHGQFRQPVVELTAQKNARHWWGPEFDQLILYRTFRPRQVEGTSPIFAARWPQVGGGDWYAGTTFILFRDNEKFLSGDLGGQTFKLWRDPTPIVDWWNEIRTRDATNKIVPMFAANVLQKMISIDILKALKD